MLYGKWRPQGFTEVVGQDHIVTTLRNALASGQIAHAYLFCGPRGTGKTTTARILARALNCENLKGGEPCGTCPSCDAIARGAALDLIEMDAASNRGIEDVRELREKIAFVPSDLQRKVYLLDEVHELTTHAFNALLKTLEEPPPHAVFILATTEVHKLPATIISRCQRYDFHRIPNQAIVGRLREICDSEGFEVPQEGLMAIAVQSRGGLRDAITLVEQVVARYGEAPSTEEVHEALGLVTDPRGREVACAILGSDLARALTLAREIADDGLDMARFTRSVVDHLRGALLSSLNQAPEGFEDAELTRLAGEVGTGKLVAAIAELAKADFRLDPGSPVPLEVACASAILGPVRREPAEGDDGREASGKPSAGRRASAPPAADAAAEDSPEERFLQSLSKRCRLVSVQAGALLNGQCEVVKIEEAEVVLVFYLQALKSKLEDFLPLVTEQATQILGRPATVTLTMVSRSAPRRRPRGGHLAEAAKALGATPVKGAASDGEEQRPQ
ncbi:MAG: DNA polymerase III subunit gamma/tau [Dehalococcoidia bacterium]